MNVIEKNDGSDRAWPRRKATLVAMVLIGWVGLFYLCHHLAAGMHVSSPALSVFFSGLICALSVLGVIAVLVKKDVPMNIAGMGLVVCLAVNAGINFMIQGDRFGVEPVHFYAGLNMALIGIAVCGGVLVSRIVKKPSYLIPLAVAAGMADLWSVGFGVTREVVQSKTAMNYLLFSFPVAGRGILPMIGVTDFIFAVLFISLSHRFDMPVKKTMVIVGASFIVSITIAIVAGFGVPVLPVMGGLFIIGQYRHVKMVDPKEKRDAITGILIIAGALLVVTWIKSL